MIVQRCYCDRCQAEIVDPADNELSFRVDESYAMLLNLDLCRGCQMSLAGWLGMAEGQPGAKLIKLLYRAFAPPP